MISFCVLYFLFCFVLLSLYVLVSRFFFSSFPNLVVWLFGRYWDSCRHATTAPPNVSSKATATVGQSLNQTDSLHWACAGMR